MNRKQIAVTGIGAVSAAGPDVQALTAGLLKAKNHFVPNHRFDLGFDVTVGEAQSSAFASHEHSELDSPTGRICLAAARECTASAKENGSSHPDGLILGTSTGGQSMNEAVVFALLDGKELHGFNYRGQGCMAAPTRLVARDLDILGPVQTVSTACTSSANAIALGAAWISSGRCRQVLAGGGDALCYTTIACFHILKLTGLRKCKPFGENRPGLTLGEGAGFLMLESLDDVLKNGREPLAVLLGSGMSSDAHHMTAPPEDGSGAEKAMRSAIDAAGLDLSEVVHVNAHGTGTLLNDAAEASAIKRLWGTKVPVMSCKGLVGHTLGGAGGIEAVASVLALQEHRAFENQGTSIAAQDCPIYLVPPDGIELPKGAAIISNSFAFGGNNCSLVFGAKEGVL